MTAMKEMFLEGHKFSNYNHFRILNILESPQTLVIWMS
jgi:hypothetical protein